MPLIDLLFGMMDRVSVFAYPQASTVFNAAGIDFHSVENGMTAEDVISQSHPWRFLLTGSSLDVSDDYSWWQWAMTNDIPNVAFVDQWVNYWQRFSTGTSVAQRFNKMPGRIAVIDQFAHDRMVESGCSPDRLVITGTPAVDRLMSFDENATKILRNQFLSGSDGLVVLYVCEPGHPADALEANLNVLARTLEMLAEKEAIHFGLILRPHPRQIEAKETLFVPSSISKHLEISIDNSDRLAVLHAADIVVGHRSFLLYEASLVGTPTISLGLDGLSVSDKCDHLVVVHNAPELEKSLEASVALCGKKRSYWTDNPSGASLHFLQMLGWNL